MKVGSKTYFDMLAKERLSTIINYYNCLHIPTFNQRLAMAEYELGKEIGKHMIDVYGEQAARHVFDNYKYVGFKEPLREAYDMAVFDTTDVDDSMVLILETLASDNTDEIIKLACDIRRKDHERRDEGRFC